MKFRDYLKESEANFVIPEKLKKYVQVTNDINDAKNWKAKIILGNNGGKKGELDDVGYIAVSPTSNIIVPIARHDEHQAGYELIDHLINKKIIPNEKYHTLYSRGENYIYGGQDEDYMNKAISAYKKWLELGGKDLNLNGANSIKYSGTISDFIKRVKEITKDGDVLLDLDSIFPKGQAVIRELIELSLQYKKLLNDKEISHGKEKQIDIFIKRVSNFINDLDSFGSKYPQRLFNTDARKTWKEQITKAEADGDLQKAGDILFGMDGIKNTIHQALKAIVAFKKMPKNAWYDDSYYKDAFGHIKKSIKEFDKMGAI
jgi:hypothetical protein